MNTRPRSKEAFGVFVALGLLIALFPTSALADTAAFTMEVASINGSPTGGATEVTASPGDVLTLDFFFEGWAPSELKGCEFAIDAAGLTSGEAGSLTLASFACSSDDDCFAGSGVSACLDGVCAGMGTRCDYPGGECNDSSECLEDPEGVFCDCYASVFIDVDRSDYVFFNLGAVTAADCLSPFAFAGHYRMYSVSWVAQPDPGVRRYIGTIILTLSDDAAGDFTIPFLAHPAYTSAYDSNYAPIPVDVSATVTVHAVAPEVPIPTVSEWGLVITALLLLAAAKVHFGRRRSVLTT